jgi:hypothetical protein
MVSAVQDDGHNVAAFAEWLRDSRSHECDVWLGVLNSADLDLVVKHFAAIPRRGPRAVQLFVMDQEQLFFRVWMIRDGRLQQYASDRPDETDDEFWGSQRLKRV